MAIYKRGGVYWYEFVFKGDRIRESTHIGNQNVARQIEAARKSALAKGEVGILDRPAAPTLKLYAPEFEAEVETQCREKPDTVKFYKEKLRRLLAYDPLASARLDAIDENLIGAYRQSRSRQVSRYGRPLSAASVNRELATLRRLLRIAHDQGILLSVPKVKLLRGERNRDFVLSHVKEREYLDATPQPLRDLAVLILDTGMRVGEARTLQTKHVHLKPATGAKFGYLKVEKGKSKYAARNLSLTKRVSQMLKQRAARARGGLLFPGDVEDQPVLGTYLDRVHARTRSALKLSSDFVIHSLRHTMLTRLGEAGADAFTIMRIAGHSSVTVSQRYVHPSPESLERAFERLDALNSEKNGRGKKVPTISPTVKPMASRKLS